MKLAFNRSFVMPVSAVTYAFLAACLYVNTGHIVFTALFLILSCASIATHWLFFRKKESVCKKHFMIMAGISILVVLMGLTAFYSVLNQSDGLLLYYAVVASIPVLYNACGIAYETELDKKNNVLSYALGILVVPFSVFLLLNIANGINAQSVFLIILICGIYAIIFMLINIILISYRRKGEKSESAREPGIASRQYYIITFVLALFMPLTGLMINVSLGGFSGSGGLFGDFSSPAFYLLALINGGLLMLPKQKNDNLRLLLFFLKSAGYTYILYFFVVFIPILPIGLFALMVMIGVYAFAPLLITIWQGKHLWNEFVFLKSRYGKRILAAVFAAGLITLPTALFAMIYNDRPNLENAAKYLYNLPPEEYKDVNPTALDRSLVLIESTYDFTDTRMGILETGYPEGNIPILSNIYKNYVMHDQVIGSDNIRMLRKIFFDEQNGTQSGAISTRTANSGSVKLTDVTVSTEFDHGIQAYRSWIDLELKNMDEGRQEYRTTFSLPEGAYISDYYLYVFDEKKMGLLTDERAAVFIYNSIVRKQLDPGLLHYINDEIIELRVFPFESDETRKTGFEVIHKQQFSFELDGRTIDVEGDGAFPDFEVNGAVLLSSVSIEKLPTIEREPHYNFVIDCSKNSNIDVLKKEVLDYAEQKGIAEASVYFASYRVDKTDLKGIGATKVKKQGGFNLNLAVNKIFSETSDGKIPIIVAVSENMPRAVIPERTKAGLYPESGYYYSLNYNFTLTPYSFEDNTEQDRTDEPIIEKVASYNGVAVKNDGQNKVVVLSSEQVELTGSQYTDAVLLRSETLKNIYYEGQIPVSHIRKSFRANILTRATAFIVVETKEQEKELLALQEKLLNEEHSEPETVQELSEPPVVILIGLCVAVLIVVGILKRLRSRVLFFE